MTQNEREELIFDLAQHRVKQLSDAGIFAMAVDQMCGLLSRETNEQLLKVSLGYSPKKDKSKAGKGF